MLIHQVHPFNIYSVELDINTTHYDPSTQYTRKREPEIIKLNMKYFVLFICVAAFCLGNVSWIFKNPIIFEIFVKFKNGHRFTVTG